MTNLALWLRSAGHFPALALVLMFLGSLALRIPFRSEYLVNWDAVNFALGTRQFNLENHQPHPPGYVGYIFLGRWLNGFTGDANASFTLVSMVCGAAAPVLFYLFASIFIPKRIAFTTAVLFALSPVVWYYSEVALTYVVELSFALFFLWAAFIARRDHSTGHFVLATLALVLIGALRQSGAAFMLPLWLYVAWSLPWGSRLSAGALLIAGSIAWLVPLLWLSGGVGEYLRISSELADTVVKPTSVLSLEAGGISRNFGFLAAGLLLGANFGLLVIAIAIFQRMNPFAPFMRHWLFFALWLGPVAATYVLVHTGQLGYALLLLPAVFLLVGSSLAGMFGHSRARESHRRVRSMAVPARAYAAAIIVVALGAVSAGMFMFFPRAINAVANSGGPGAVMQGISLNISEDPPPPSQPGSSVNLPDRTRPFDLRVNDKHWHSMINFVNAFRSYEVAILTAPNWEGSFRHLTYYLPEYRVYGVGHDLNGRFGLLFSAYGGSSDYSLEKLARSSPMLRLDPQAHLLLIPDWEVARRIQGVDVTEFTLDSGSTIAMAWAPENTILTFARQ